MTQDMMTLRALLEKSSDADLLCAPNCIWTQSNFLPQKFGPSKIAASDHKYSRTSFHYIKSITENCYLEGFLSARRWLFYPIYSR